jgi:1-deoxy-D-xylulose-5-phosphate reductoisomerase
LFHLPPDRIEVVIHPQSVIHSMVQFRDGSIKAQMGLPDMRLPIQYALGYPERLPSSFPRFSFTGCSELTFEQPDGSVFRNLPLAYEAIRQGGNLPCIMNAANEVVVDAFLHDGVKFLDMPGIIEETMGKVPYVSDPSLEDLEEADTMARRYALGRVGERNPV